MLPDLGLTNYFVRIPLSVKYVNVYQGSKPTFVYTLKKSSDFALIPKYGKVNGPATVLYWSDYHTFGYTKNIKAKVQYNTKGSFKIYAYDHEFETVLGLPAWDDDSFTVNVK